LKSKTGQCNILLQLIYYMKKFETDGSALPTTLFVGDRNECFALKSNAVMKYLYSQPEEQ